LFASLVVLISSPALAQTPGANSTAAGEASLATPAGHEVNLNAGHYTYAEPDAPGIKIHGPKFGAEYTGTFVFSPERHWFAQANVRGSVGSVTYDGACAPWLITPDPSSPNGYSLDLGDFSPCSETGDADWYLEGRALVGKDVVGPQWAWSPYTGAGLRHLSNGTTGVSGYRTDDYLYVPFGLTARTRVASQRVVSVTVEYDRLIHGWQKTRDSSLGSGVIPATPTAPAFSIDGFTDISFSQSSGWALRASADYQVSRHWSVAPYYIHWTVGATPVNDETVTFTVNAVSAKEHLGAYEPFNTTNEFGVKLGLHF
jgi:hypothetical protein